jgi:hypothetical protein
MSGSGSQMTDIEAAREVRDGRLPSPWSLGNSWLFAIRVSGTGGSFRSGRDEFVWRNPDQWLTDETLQRCAGLPVTWGHPEGDILTSKEYGQRVIGACVLPYIRGDEIWSVARINDADAARAMTQHQFSTSPCVMFPGGGEGERIEGDDGSTLLIEGRPALLDHVAICEQGVWDKDGEPSGVLTGEADVAEDDRLAEILAAIQNVGERVAALEEGRAAADKHLRKHIADDEPDRPMHERVADLRKRFDDDDRSRLSDATRRFLDKTCDDDDDNDDKATREARRDARRLLAADDRRARRDDDDDRRRHDDDRRRRRDFEPRRREDEHGHDPMDVEGTQPRPTAADAQYVGAPHLTKRENDELRSRMAAMQCRADSIYAAFSESAPRFLDGETALAYQRRLLRDFQKHSPVYRNIDLRSIADPALLEAAATIIYADAMTANRNQQNQFARQGVLVERKRRDATGREISEFYGDPLVWMSQFMMPRRRVTKFLTPQSGGGRMP